MPTTDQLPTLMDITRLAEHLGVAPRHIRRLVAERRIPFIKWGHLIRFDPRRDRRLDQRVPPPPGRAANRCLTDLIVCGRFEDVVSRSG